MDLCTAFLLKTPTCKEDGESDATGDEFPLGRWAISPERCWTQGYWFILSTYIVGACLLFFVSQPDLRVDPILGTTHLPSLRLLLAHVSHSLADPGRETAQRHTDGDFVLVLWRGVDRHANTGFVMYIQPPLYIRALTLDPIHDLYRFHRGHYALRTCRALCDF